jgi:hypothetical protein
MQTLRRLAAFAFSPQSKQAAQLLVIRQPGISFNTVTNDGLLLVAVVDVDRPGGLRLARHGSACGGARGLGRSACSSTTRELFCSLGPNLTRVRVYTRNSFGRNYLERYRLPELDAEVWRPGGPRIHCVLFGSTSPRSFGCYVAGPKRSTPYGQYRRPAAMVVDWGKLHRVNVCEWQLAIAPLPYNKRCSRQALFGCGFAAMVVVCLQLN